MGQFDLHKKKSWSTHSWLSIGCRIINRKIIKISGSYLSKA